MDRIDFSSESADSNDYLVQHKLIGARAVVVLTLMLFISTVLFTAGCSKSEEQNNLAGTSDSEGASGTVINDETKTDAPFRTATPAPFKTATPPADLSSTAKSTSRGSSDREPASLGIFGTIRENGKLRLYFQLLDTAGSNTTSDGTISVVATDDRGNVVFEYFGDVSADEFSEFVYAWDGKALGTAYEWTVPATAINKGIVKNWGTAQLEFISPNQRSLSAIDRTFEVTSFSYQELERLSEQEFQTNAEKTRLSAENDEFSVEVLMIGRVTDYKYSVDQPTSYVRVDARISFLKELLFDVDPVLIDRNGFSYAHSSLLSEGLPYGYHDPGVNDVSIAFEGLAENAEPQKLIFGDLVFDLITGMAFSKKQQLITSYETNRTEIGQTVTNGETTVNLEYAGLTETEEGDPQLKVEFTILNNSDEFLYFSPIMYLVLSDSTQIESNYEGPLFDFTPIAPGASKPVYALFDGAMPEDEAFQIYFQEGWGMNFEIYKWFYEFTLD